MALEALEGVLPHKVYRAQGMSLKLGQAMPADKASALAGVINRVQPLCTCSLPKESRHEHTCRRMRRFCWLSMI